MSVRRPERRIQERWQIQAACREEGLLALTAGENVLRLLPPLVVTEDDIKEAVDKLGAAFAAIDAETANEHVTA